MKDVPPADAIVPPRDPSMRAGYSFGFIHRPPEPDSESSAHIETPKPNFELRQLIGLGGQGEVWEAWQASLRRPVAVKIHRGGASESFLQEAFITAELDHPNIVPVFEMGPVDAASTELAMAMKRVRGRGWDELIPKEGVRGAAELARHLAILTDICFAIAYAHSRGIVHLDLKPSQVIVGEFGEVFLMDWGLAARLDRAAGSWGRCVEDIEEPLGTPAYAAPEQALGDGAAIGIATDVYLVGGLLHYILSGGPIHPGRSAAECLDAARRNRTAALPPDAPVSLATLVSAATAASPGERLQSIDEFRLRIEEFLAQSSNELEAQQLLREEQAHTASLAALPHAELVESERRLARAIALAPKLDAAAALRDAVLAQMVRVNVGSGDLEIARSTAGQIRSPDVRIQSLHIVAEASAARTARERQRVLARRAAMGAMAACVVIFAAASWLLARSYSETSAARDTAEGALARAQRELYRSELQAAQLQVANGNHALARQLLWQAPAGHRGWEWGYLMSQATPEDYLLAPRDEQFRRIAVSRDGATLAALGADGSLAIHDAADGRRIWKSAASASYTALCALDGGGHVATNAAGDVVSIGAAGATRTLFSPGERISTLDARGGSVAALTEAGGVVHYAEATGITRPTLDAPAAALALSGDGRALFMGLESGAVVRFSEAEGTTALAERHRAPVRRIVSAPGGMLLASVAFESGFEQPRSDPRVILWSADSAAPVRVLEPDDFAAIAVEWSPDGEFLYVGTAGALVQQYRTADWSRGRTHYHQHGLPGILRAAPEGGLLAIGSRRAVVVWNMELDIPERTLSADGRHLHDAAWLGDRIVMVGSDGGIGIWDARAEPHASYYRTYPDRAVSLDAASAAPVLISGHLSGSTTELSTAAALPEWIGTSWQEDGLIQVRTSADGTVRCSIDSDGTVRWETAQNSGPAALVFETGAPLVALALHPDGTRAVLADRNGTLHEHAPDGSLRELFKRESGHFSALCHGPDGRRLFAGGSDGRIDVLEEGVVLSTLEGHHARIGRLSISADGSTLVSASDDETARTWDAATGRPLQVFRGSHAGAVTAAVFVPGPGRVITASLDDSVRVFEAETGAELLVLTEHQYGVLDMVLDQSGRWLHTVGREGHRRAWMPLPWRGTQPADFIPQGVPADFEHFRRHWSWP